jgi:peptidoglycan/LPS O-acetylase OafA/YrhL
MRALDGRLASNKREIPALNGLRGLAALIVFVSHFSNQSGIWGKVLGDGGGQLGVMIFFALSGFLMAYLYLGLPWTRQTVVAYAVARAARVLPLYLVVVLAACCLNTLGVIHPRVYEVTGSNLTEHLLFWKGASVLWTIPPEIWFYGIFAGIWSVQTALPRRFLLPLVLFALALAMNAVVARLGLSGVFPSGTAPEALVRVSSSSSLGVWVGSFSPVLPGSTPATRAWSTVSLSASCSRFPSSFGGSSARSSPIRR